MPRLEVVDGGVVADAELLVEPDVETLLDALVGAEVETFAEAPVCVVPAELVVFADVELVGPLVDVLVAAEVEPVEADALVLALGVEPDVVVEALADADVVPVETETDAEGVVVDVEADAPTDVEPVLTETPIPSSACANPGASPTSTAAAAVRPAGMSTDRSQCARRMGRSYPPRKARKRACPPLV